MPTKKQSEADRKHRETMREIKRNWLTEVVVSVAMPRSEWLLLETILVVWESARSAPKFRFPLSQDLRKRVRQMNAFIIEAERREARRIQAWEES